MMSRTAAVKDSQDLILYLLGLYGKQLMTLTMSRMREKSSRTREKLTRPWVLVNQAGDIQGQGLDIFGRTLGERFNSI